MIKWEDVCLIGQDFLEVLFWLCLMIGDEMILTRDGGINKLELKIIYAHIRFCGDKM